MKNVVTPALLRDIDKSLNTLFNRGRGRVPGFVNRLCARVQSNSAEELYGWLKDLPKISEKQAETARTRLALEGHGVRNKEYTGIIEVPRSAIEDDQYGVFGLTAEQFGQRGEQVPDLELIAALNASFTTLQAFTGKAFFATDHKVDKTTFSNKGTKKLSAANFETGYAAIRGVKDGAGVPLFTLSDPSKVFLVVSPTYEATADAIVRLDTLSTGGKNPNYNKAQVLVMPGLSEHHWFILDCSNVVTPFIFQDRVPLELTAQMKLTDDIVFNDDMFAWKARRRCAIATGMPQYAYGSTGADAA
jgi:phage major head subunit gpT-like protein